MRRYSFNELEIIAQARAFMDDWFVDMPGYFEASGGDGSGPVNWPRKTLQVELCSDVMRVFPSFRFEDLQRMPLALFWQWLHAARAVRVTEYRNYQLTDFVNTKANAELNRLKREAVSRN